MRRYLGLAVVVLGLFWPQIETYIKNRMTNSVDYNTILELKKPSDDDYKSVSAIKKVMTGPDQKEDREKMAVFHNELAKRSANYPEYTTNQFEGLYYDASKEFFEGKINGKYQNLGDEIYNLILATLGENEGIVSKEESEKLAEKMRAMSYVLLNDN